MMHHTWHADMHNYSVMKLLSKNQVVEVNIILKLTQLWLLLTCHWFKCFFRNGWLSHQVLFKIKSMPVKFIVIRLKGVADKKMLGGIVVPMWWSLYANIVILVTVVLLYCSMGFLISNDPLIIQFLCLLPSLSTLATNDIHASYVIIQDSTK